MSARRTETTQEALAYTRRTLGPADPARGDEFNGAARTPEGRAVLARILADQPEARGHAKATRQLRSHAEAARQPRGHVREPRKPRVRVRGTRRRWLVAAATVMALGGVTAMADAMGVLPSGVVDGLTRVQDDGMGEVDLDRARLLVAGPMPDGRRTMEVWQAPNKSGGTCLHTRYVADDGTAEGGGTECSNGAGATPLDRLPLWTGGGTTEMPGYDTLYGHAAEPAVTVRITWADGARRTVPLNPDGTFLTFVRSRPGTEGEYRTIDALDRQGKVVTSDPHG
ncbi:hypothetical protein SMD44_01021 [Streptomyces alboflavus]|uniref:Uncharacterized protein n=1 Tax=Streptomyces alboflavus TaxID=67267 RepID=A0A1Z1W598_9ACTN|nr:hypothetical protein [Streptomyces alboflavus]ARX81623.1 hypothetical protein SMD44_01021 [Streptomyces alboflavus]